MCWSVFSKQSIFAYTVCDFLTLRRLWQLKSFLMKMKDLNILHMGGVPTNQPTVTVENSQYQQSAFQEASLGMMAVDVFTMPGVKTSADMILTQI